MNLAKVKTENLWFILMILVVMKPTPVHFVGSFIGLKLLDVVSFALATLILGVYLKKLNGSLFTSIAFLFLVLVIALEMISYLVGSFYHESSLEDVVEFSRWVLYAPIFFAGYIGANVLREKLVSQFAFVLLIFSIFSMMLFFDVGGFKKYASYLYDLGKSRGIENSASSLGLWRLSSTFSNPNYFGIFSVLALSFLLSYSSIYKKISIYVAAEFVVLIAFVVLSGSRTALASMFFVLVYFAFVNVKRMFLKFYGVGAFFVVVFICSVPFLIAMLFDIMTEKLWRFSNVANMRVSLGGRMDAWKGASDLVMSDPLLFVFGYGSNKELFQSLDNNYISFFLKNGIVGLTLFLGLLLHCFYIGCINSRSNSNFVRLLGNCLALSVFVMSFASLTSTPFHHAQLAMIFFFVVGANSLARTLESEQDGEKCFNGGNRSK